MLFKVIAIVVLLCAAVSFCVFIVNESKRARVIFGIIFVLSLGALLRIEKTPVKIKEESQIYELIALQDTQTEENNYQNAVWVMRMDKIEVPVYRFYYKNEVGEIRFAEISVHDVSIIICTDQEPCYEVIASVNGEKQSLFGLEDTKVGDTTYRYKLYIPEGSMIYDIKLDMQ